MSFVLVGPLLHGTTSTFLEWILDSTPDHNQDILPVVVPCKWGFRHTVHFWSRIYSTIVTTACSVLLCTIWMYVHSTIIAPFSMEYHARFITPEVGDIFRGRRWRKIFSTEGVINLGFHKLKGSILLSYLAISLDSCLLNWLATPSHPLMI